MKTCNDAISRAESLRPYQSLADHDVISVGLIKKNIMELSNVQPTQKTGQWVMDDREEYR